MDSDAYIKSVNSGLFLGCVSLFLAGGAATVIFLILAVGQIGFLIWFPPTLGLALFTVGILLLLKKDAKARAEAGRNAEKQAH